MSKELTVQNAQIEKVTDDELIMHLDNLGLLKSLSPGEKNTYMQICKAYNLNPFKREIHVSKYGDKMSVITGYETYIKRAERSGVLDGWEVKTEGSVATGDLKAIITIYRKDRSRPFVWEAEYSEYVQNKSANAGGGPNQFWQKGKTMIKKVAMAQGFRLCFSDELGGMPYSSEEVSTEDAVFTDVTPAQPTAQSVPATPIPVSKEPKQFDALQIIKDAESIKDLNASFLQLPKTLQKDKTIIDAAGAKKAALQLIEDAAKTKTPSVNENAL